MTQMGKLRLSMEIANIVATLTALVESVRKCEHDGQIPWPWVKETLLQMGNHLDAAIDAALDEMAKERKQNGDGKLLP